jgi:thiol:disulfide interchange protein DsbC
MNVAGTALKGVAILLLSLALALPVLAEEDEDVRIDRVRQSLALLLPSVKIDEVSATAVPNLYEVVVGTRLVYVTGDGRHLFQGEIIDLEMRKNLTEPRVNAVKAAAVEKVGEDRMVIYAPKETRHTVTVFTDIDCAYCRKLHMEMEKYNEKGIKIRYLFFPRAGLASASYRKAVSVWCAEDRNKAMTIAKKGEELEGRECDNPVQDHMILGEMMGVTGTPALVLESGEMLPGYIPADRLSALLESGKGKE